MVLSRLVADDIARTSISDLKICETEPSRTATPSPKMRRIEEKPPLN